MASTTSWMELSPHHAAKAPLSQQVLGEMNAAAVLNANARQVSASILAEVTANFPGAVFLTKSQAEAEQRLDMLLESGFDAIFAGGGDGTIVHTLNSLADQLQRRGMTPSEGPHVGLLPLGTGNALAGHYDIGSPLGADGWLHAHTLVNEAPLRLLQGHDGRFPFAGFGLDGAVLNEYIGFKKALENTPLEQLTQGMTGYLAASLRTLQCALTRRGLQPMIQIVNTGGRAWRVDTLTGQRLQSYEPGEVLYSGPSQWVAGSSTSCYGFDMQLFPHAEACPDRFQMRVFNGSPLKAITQLPSLFNGTFEDPSLHDFLVESVSIWSEAPQDYQVAGDAMGTRQRWRWRLDPTPFSVIKPQRVASLH